LVLFSQRHNDSRLEKNSPSKRGSLLELEDALVSMHSAPRRSSLRDFSIWPSIPGPRIYSPDEITRIKAYIEEQRRTMWEPAGH
jgi:hypothetical protein